MKKKKKQANTIKVKRWHQKMVTLARDDCAIGDRAIANVCDRGRSHCSQLHQPYFFFFLAAVRLARGLFFPLFMRWEFQGNERRCRLWGEEEFLNVYCAFLDGGASLLQHQRTIFVFSSQTCFALLVLCFSALKACTFELLKCAYFSHHRNSIPLFLS